MAVINISVKLPNIPKEPWGGWMNKLY